MDQAVLFDTCADGIWNFPIVKPFFFVNVHGLFVHIFLHYIIYVNYDTGWLCIM